MSTPDLTSALMGLTETVGRVAGQIESLTNELHANERAHDRRITAIESRVNDLEAHRDREAGAAAAALSGLERRIKVFGALVAFVGLIETAVIAVIL